MSQPEFDQLPLAHRLVEAVSWYAFISGMAISLGAAASDQIRAMMSGQWPGSCYCSWISSWVVHGLNTNSEAQTQINGQRSNP